MTRRDRHPKGSIAFVGIRGCAIVEQIAQRYRTTAHALRENTRRDRVVLPRQHAMAALRAAGFTERAIGTYFDRDHSTVSTGAARHDAREAWGEFLIACVPGQQLAVAA